jgi:hypothetical protein
MKRTNIYLAEGQAAALDRVAQAAGVSRAEQPHGTGFPGLTRPF